MVKYVVGVAIRWDVIIIEMFSQPGKLLRIAVSYCVQFVLPVTSLYRTRSRFDHRCGIPQSPPDQHLSTVPHYIDQSIIHRFRPLTASLDPGL